MPLTGAIQYQIPLLQQQILTVRYGMQRALIHICQFAHGMSFTGEQEALLLLLIPEGINAFHAELSVHTEAVSMLCADLLRCLLGIQERGCLPHKGTDRKQNIRSDADRLIQIKMLVILTVMAHRQNADTAVKGDPSICLCPEDNGFALRQSQRNSFILLK